MENQNDKRRRKLRALVITMAGSSRKAHIEDLFASEKMRETFAPPEFSDGIPSRKLRNRFEFLTIAHEAGLIPEEEWEALKIGQENPDYQIHTERFFDCLQSVPVKPGRRGSKQDVQLHYSVELWRKAKTINRGRAVLACTLAHLIALKRFVAEGFDAILEDNVRVPLEDCAERIWQAKEATDEWEQHQNSKSKQPDKCHMQYLGWLGSIPNLEWILQRHAEKRSFSRQSDSPQSDQTKQSLSNYTIFPFPTTEEIMRDLRELEKLETEQNSVGDAVAAELDDNDENEDEASAKTARKPGGNPVWGSYAYWISKQGYTTLLEELQNDVGSLLWKGKRMRFYVVKPVDKVLPRKLMAKFGQEAVQMTTHPAFFRAPMLTSKIHTQWDPEFCKSTEYQLQQAGGLGWRDLWLTDDEQEIISHYEQHREWITLGRLLERRNENN
jgi:GR25 family glycosyltransferase involved in LPS biosynthesis